MSVGEHIVEGKYGGDQNNWIRGKRYLCDMFDTSVNVGLEVEIKITKQIYSHLKILEKIERGIERGHIGACSCT